MQSNSSTAQPARRAAVAAIGLVTLWLASACGATRLQNSWVKPDAESLDLEQFVTIAMTNDSARRRMMEDAFAREIQDDAPGVEAVASHSLLSDAQIKEEAQLRDRLDRSRYDAAVVMRITDVERRDVFVPGRTVVVPEYYRTFWGYYRHWRPIAYEPGYIERNRDVQVETQVYSLASGDLVYAAVSRTLNPSSSTDLVEAVASVVVDDLQKRGIIARGFPIPQPE